MSTRKRAGSRRGPRQSRRPRPRPLAYAAGITLAAIAWGYLVYMAIDFGQSARGGQNSAWAFLSVAAVGAMACLFAGLMLGIRLLREVGIITNPSSSTEQPPTQPTPRGGRRRA